ncbi:hypothetical protein ONS95_012919 [Cadophora gregata]|uniref:uncharacterized protein n=1 Tax=Cadophora gregata TaxID=51156 RepID=UPI0026DB03CF|nr:uncharacterized protein ONS95_012919 [Cadophora gregata]KAK0101098.1 hypothetical protein ONS96_006324 [Cadophora gregata f. sp. sojae]KAK0115870.1 hypothetical protein ONS95_012919 [Cadophora gregata]
MGVPSSVRWYHLLGFFILVGSRDLYLWTLIKIRDFYDHSCNILNSTIYNLQITSRNCLRLLQLAPPPEFTRFGTLPLEIRRLIWSFAASQPRVIELGHSKDRKTRKHVLPTHEIENGGGIRSIAEIPPVLHTCRESRAEGLKRYILAFGTPEHEARVYVNFANDVVFLGRRCPIYSAVGSIPATWSRRQEHCVRMNDLEKITRLAIRCESSWGLVVNAWDRERFGGVREVVVVGQRWGERRFDLGRRPDLRVSGEEGVRWEDVGSVGSEIRKFVGIRVLEDRVGIRGERLGESERLMRRDVVVRDGSFVKGLGDKWFSPRRSWVF